ncbi:MAG: FG-GAP repeat protein [Alphaproteobacteria bacterium]|nr:FG-GAP repeat protein [Alphaproteobacteria bacterium]
MHATLVLQGVEDGDRFGQAVATPGDLDGDGFEELVIAAPCRRAEEAPVNEHVGAIYVVWGNATRLSSQRTIQLAAPEQDDILEIQGEFAADCGATVGLSSLAQGQGDYDGDGLPDLAFARETLGVEVDSGDTSFGLVYLLRWADLDDP